MKFGKIRIEDGNFIFAKRMLINYLPCKDILWAYMRREGVEGGMHKQFSTSYSAARGALNEFWRTTGMHRDWFADSFCQPVYEMFLAEAVALGRINAPGFFTDPLVREAWCGARWIGPVQGSLDPKKEAEAALMLIDNAIKTHEQVSREMSGGDWEENVEQLQRENELLTQAGGNKVTVISASPKEGDGDED